MHYAQRFVLFFLGWNQAFNFDWPFFFGIYFTFYQLAGGRVPHSLPAKEREVEATAENNDESNQSSYNGSSTQKNKEGTDTQVSIFLSFDIGFNKD